MRRVIVLGAGVAGHSAVCWLRDWGAPYLWLDDQAEAGGMLHRLHNPLHNTPGQRHADGPSLARALLAERAALGVGEPERFEAARVVRAGEQIVVVGRDGREEPCTTLILATGARYRRLGVPGEQEALAAGLARESASGYAASVAGCRVAVIGGGDAAYEGALILARHGCEVHIIQRDAAPRARAQFVEPASASPLIHVVAPARVREIITAGGGVRLELDGAPALEVACVFIRIGVAPRVPELWEAPQVDDEGYLRVDAAQRTSVGGVLAAGDVTDSPLKSVVWAAGSGARAAWTAWRAS